MEFHDTLGNNGVKLIRGMVKAFRKKKNLTFVKLAGVGGVRSTNQPTKKKR